METTKANFWDCKPGRIYAHELDRETYSAAHKAGKIKRDFLCDCGHIWAETPQGLIRTCPECDRGHAAATQGYMIEERGCVTCGIELPDSEHLCRRCRENQMFDFCSHTLKCETSDISL